MIRPVPKPEKKKKTKKKRLNRKLPMEQWPLKSLIKEADHWHSKYIVQRDGRCVTCGSTKNLGNGHLISRYKGTVRYDPENCNCQCNPCNGKHEHYPEHYTRWFINKHGQDKYNFLVAKSIPTKKWDKDELIDIINKCKTVVG